jgi:hypothetical protein
MDTNKMKLNGSGEGTIVSGRCGENTLSLTGIEP